MRRLVAGWLTLAALGVAQPSSPQTPAMAAPRLGPGRAVERRLPPGAVHTGFALAVAAGQTVRLSLAARGADLVLSLKDPAGHDVLTTYRVPAGSPAEVFTWVAQASGDHLVAVKAAPAEERAGSYTLRHVEVRAATEEDRRLVEAQAAASDLPAKASDFDRVMARWTAALPLLDGLDEPGLKSRLLSSLGSLHRQRGEPQSALRRYQESHALRRRLGPFWEASALVNLIGMYSSLDEPEKVIEHYFLAREPLRRSGSASLSGAALSNVGTAYLALRNYREADRYFREALPLLRRSAQVSILNNLGTSQEGLGDLEAALRYYQRSLSLTDGRDDQAARALMNIGGVHRLRGRYGEARPVLEEALALRRTLGDHPGQANTLQLLGDVHLGLGDAKRALESYEAALKLARAMGKRDQEASVFLSLARMERDEGRLGQARQRVEEAVGLFESSRSRLVNEDLLLSYGALVREAYDVQVDVLMRLHEQDPRQGLDRAALEVSERSRGHGLMLRLREAGVGIREGVDPALLQRERRLDERIAEQAGARTTLLDTDQHARAAALEQEIAELVAEHAQVQAEIRRTSPRYASLTQPAPLSAAEIQALQGPQTVLLEYHLGRDRSYAWVIRRESLAAYRLPPEEVVNEQARALHRSLSEPYRPPRVERESRTLAERLSETILGPIPRPPEGSRLVVVADGALHYIPPAVLPLPRTWTAAPAPIAAGDAPALLSRYETVSLLSASVGALLRQPRAAADRPGKEMAVLAHPVFDAADPRVRSRPGRARNANGPSKSLSAERRIWPALPYTGELARDILRDVPPDQRLMALGFAANRAAATGPGLRDYRIVVFATHGWLDDAQPGLSGVVLSMVDEAGQPLDGMLRLKDVYNLSLNAELVVLAACQTGLGREVKGEGLVTLARGFMYAGASRVLASLWEVPEETTMELVRRFLEAVRAGKPYPRALREAQQSLASRRSPYHWAGFVLQGSWE